MRWRCAPTWPGASFWGLRFSFLETRTCGACMCATKMKDSFRRMPAEEGCVFVRNRETRKIDYLSIQSLTRVKTSSRFSIVLCTTPLIHHFSGKKGNLHPGRTAPAPVQFDDEDGKLSGGLRCSGQPL